MRFSKSYIEMVCVIVDNIDQQHKVVSWALHRPGCQRRGLGMERGWLSESNHF